MNDNSRYSSRGSPKEAEVDFITIRSHMPTDFLLEVLDEPQNFGEWQNVFKARPEVKKVLESLEDVLINKAGGHAPESPTYDHLEYWILRACYETVHFKDIFGEKRKKERKERELTKDLIGQGRTASAIVEELLEFVEKKSKRYPEAVNRIAQWWFLGAYGSRPAMPKRLQGRPPLEMLKRNLTGLKNSFELYATKARKISSWPCVGCLSFPQPGKKGMIKGLQDPARDSLIFELAFLIRRYLSKKPSPPLMELPSRGHFARQNEVIAELINATLEGSSICAEKVKERLDFLTKAGAKYVGWERHCFDR